MDNEPEAAARQVPDVGGGGDGVQADICADVDAEGRVMPKLFNPKHITGEFLDCEEVR